MVPIIFLLMVGIPIAEIAVFIEVGGWLGLWPTISIIILTALMGAVLLRQQGLATLRNVQQSLEQNRLPLVEVFDGLCLLVAGAFLLTPGFVTDGLGLLLFFPPFRTFLRYLLARYWTASGRIDIRSDGFNGGETPDGGGRTIEGEYIEINGENIEINPGPEDSNQDPPSLPPRNS